MSRMMMTIAKEARRARPSGPSIVTVGGPFGSLLFGAGRQRFGAMRRIRSSAGGVVGLGSSARTADESAVGLRGERRGR
jgi:hypothetical protein